MESDTGITLLNIHYCYWICFWYSSGAHI